MIERMILGLLTGLGIGLVIAVAHVQGLGRETMGALTAYPFAAVAGALTGLVAGKPIWAKGGQVEAGLKAFFGALLAVGALFAVRTWLHARVDLSTYHIGKSTLGVGEIGELPIAAFPLLAGVLGAFFEADNSDDADGAKGLAKGARASDRGNVARPRVGAAADADAGAEGEAEEPKKSRS